MDRRKLFPGRNPKIGVKALSAIILRKEVIQPQVQIGRAHV